MKIMSFLALLPGGAGAVALQRGDSLYMGSCAGDRILRDPLPAAADQ